MSDNPNTHTYYVYLPKVADCYTVEVPDSPSLYVGALADAIRKNPDIRKVLGPDETYRFFKYCKKYEDPSDKFDKAVVDWLAAGPWSQQMQYGSLLREHFPHGPAPIMEKQKTIDVVIATDSLLKALRPVATGNQSGIDAQLDRIPPALDNEAIAQLKATVENLVRIMSLDAIVAARLKPVVENLTKIMSLATGVTPKRNKRPRVSYGTSSLPSAITLLDDSETNSVHRLPYLLYKGLWRKGNLKQVIDEYTVSVPDLELSVYKGSDEQATASHFSELTARFVDLSKLDGWTPEQAELIVSRFLIRDEYDQADSFWGSVGRRNGRKKMLLVGQPGIGKTVYLTYCLLKRLASGKKTIFSWSDTRRYLFQDSGVFSIPGKTIAAAGGDVTDDRDQEALILFDLNNEQPQPFRMRNWDTIVGSSPKESQWKAWDKENQPEMFIMKTWGWEEMYISRGLAVTQRTDDQWCVAFIKYGGSARHLLSMEAPELAQRTESAVRRANAKELFRPVDTDFRDNVSSFLVEINPATDPQTGQCDRSIPTGMIISQQVLDLVIEQAGMEIVAEMKSKFNYLIKHRGTRTAADVLWEGAGHRWLFESLSSPLSVRSLSRQGTSMVLNLPHLKSVFDFCKIKELDHTKYYRPLSSRLAGVDSFALEVDNKGQVCGVVLFQFTISDHHPIKTGFLSELWAIKNFSAVTWKFIFIVPKDEEDDFVAQSWQPASEEKTWSRRVDQYVLYVDTDELYGSLRGAHLSRFRNSRTSDVRDV